MAISRSCKQGYRQGHKLSIPVNQNLKLQISQPFFCRFLAEILSLTLSLFVMYKQHKKLCKISLSILYILHPISIDDYFAKATLWSFIGSALLLKRQNMRNETCLKIVSYLLLNANFIFKHYFRSQRKITTERTNVDC